MIKEDKFVDRHIGLSDFDARSMLECLGYSNIDDFIEDVLPFDKSEMDDLDGVIDNENRALEHLHNVSQTNILYKNYFGMGYFDTILPSVVRRNVLENPAWYTAYTPYQAEISQGRLESLFNFQHLIVELTGLDVANASVLDEATSLAEAVIMCHKLYTSQGGNSASIFMYGSFFSTDS